MNNQTRQRTGQTGKGNICCSPSDSSNSGFTQLRLPARLDAVCTAYIQTRVWRGEWQHKAGKHVRGVYSTGVVGPACLPVPEFAGLLSPAEHSGFYTLRTVTRHLNLYTCFIVRVGCIFPSLPPSLPRTTSSSSFISV